MIKRFLSILLVLALSVTMFTFVASAEEATFTINWVNDPENHAFSSNYSPYTLAGTELTVSPTVSLKDGQEIHWFLNGNKVGTSGLTEDDYVEHFTFKSVDGTNAVQAKVMEGDTVVATSDIIEKNFTPIVKSGNNIFSMKLDAFESKWYYGSNELTKTYVSDPAGSGRNVMKIERTASNTLPQSALLRIDQGYPDDFSAAQTGSGIVRIDYSIYVTGWGAQLSMVDMKFSCGSAGDFKWALRADDYSRNNQTAVSGAAICRQTTLPNNEWVDVSIIIDNNRKVFDATVGDFQAITGKSYCSHENDGSYLQYFTLPAPISTGAITYYLKDLSIYKCIPAGISISSTAVGNAKAVAGSKVVINAESTFDNADIVYWCNGVKYEDNKVLASAGTNTVYAQAIGESGNVLGTSDPITFEAYADTFKISSTDTAATLEASTSAAKKQIGRYSAVAAGAAATRLFYNSVDVKPVNIVQGKSLSILSTFHINNNTEKFPTLFTVASDGINVATTIASNGGAGGYIKLPYVDGKDTYNLKTIYDPIYGSYILLVDDVVYSVIDKSAEKGTANDFTPNLSNIATSGNMYLDISLAASGDEANPNKVTLSNYKEGYSALPVAHSKVDYINNEKIVTNASELTNADDLTVRFVATKGEYEEVLCIATVLEKGGELISLATQDVTFDGTKASEEVSLELKNLPSDIADGNYTVNVMLWNKADLKPIVTKVVMP